MQHTLQQLRDGELKGVERLVLTHQQLTSFPTEIFSLADSLKILDLNHNQLTDLPDNLNRLHKLEILFCSNNAFTKLPAAIGQCANLTMVGFKSNTIRTIANNAFPANLRWLILTDNAIEVLPETIGNCDKLQKLMLAGNQIQQLPDTLAQCSNLQLLRISANNLTQFPSIVKRLPKLAWLAFSGNPFLQTIENNGQTQQVQLADIKIDKQLGQGASGTIYRGEWQKPQKTQLPSQFAVKIFKGNITSDGYPHDELAICLNISAHNNIVTTFAYAQDQQSTAALMELIPCSYRNLANPPSLSSCTRDTFSADFSLPIATIAQFVAQLTAVITHLHNLKICHGDLYAHNVLFEKQHILFGDFGAASYFGSLSEDEQTALINIEHRALGYFIDDLLSVCQPSDQDSLAFCQLKQRATELTA